MNQLSFVQDKVGKEWSDDRIQNLRERLDEFLQVHAGPGIVEGMYPKTNIQEDIQKQWDDCWQASMVEVFVHIILPGSTRNDWPS